MNVSSKAARMLRTFPEDAGNLLDAADQLARSDTSRRLITTTVQVRGTPWRLMIGRPVAGPPVLLSVELEAST